MGTLSFNASEEFEESVRLFYTHYQQHHDTTLSQTLISLLEKSIKYYDVILLLEKNPDLMLALEAEAKAITETHPPIYS